MACAVALGQVADGALESKSRLTRICGGIGDAHDHGDHLVNVAARCRHLAQSAGHLVETVARLIRVPHQLVQVAVHLVDALTGGVHDGLYVGGLLRVLFPSAGDLVYREAFYQFLACVHGLVGNVHQCRGGYDVQCRKLALQVVQRAGHGIKVYFFRSGVQFLKALFGPFELELFHQLVDQANGLLCVFLKVRIVELHLNNALVYFPAHSVLTSPQARCAIRSNIGRMAGLM